jgi:hypothetical protein
MPSLEQFGYKQELKRALTTWDLIVYGMIFMVPIAPFVIAYVLFEMDTAAKLMGACWIAAGVVYFVVLSFVLKKPVTLEL